METFLQVLAGLLVATAMGQALAHALELPGKLRLDKQQYFVVQQIYYPGFTIGGSAEPAAIIVTLLLAVFTPLGTPEFWLVAASAVAMIAMQLVFWVVTQPVNRLWLKDVKLSQSAETFFNTGDSAAPIVSDEDWIAHRDSWEHSHVTRAVVAVLGLACLLTAISL